MAKKKAKAKGKSGAEAKAPAESEAGRKPEPLGIDELPLSQEHIETLQRITRAAANGKGAHFCFFTGPSGTGKTLVAAVLANELKQPLERVKLPALFTKSAEETEKNIAALLERAQAAEAVLFFDEADALFGKRSEVKDSDDRYANQEVGYLVKALRGYRGLVILSSNVKPADGSPLSGRRAHVLTFAAQDL